MSNIYKSLNSCRLCDSEITKAKQHKQLRVLQTRLDTYEPGLKKEIHKTLQKISKDISKQVVKQLNKYQGLNALLRKDDSDKDIQKIIDALDFSGFDALIAVMSADMKAMYEEAMADGLKMVGIGTDEFSFDMVSEYAQKWVAERTAELVTNLDESTQDYLHSVLADGIESGMTHAELANSIEESFGFSETRSETIARTELSFANNNGNMDAWKESGVVEMKVSLLGSEHDVDVPGGDECDTNADQGPIGLDEEFESGDLNPPYHPRCLCAILPVTGTPDNEE